MHIVCPTCENSSFQDFTVTANGGNEMTKDKALAFAIEEGEDSILVSISCDKCDFRTSRTIIKQ